MALILSALLFLAFFANVVSGAYFGGVFLGDVAEMLLLGAAAVVFVIAILKLEADEKSRQDS